MSEELKQLITWFENYQVTFNEIRLSECENIFDLSKYIDVMSDRLKEIGIIRPLQVIY